jgi:ATP synthase protein I
MAQKGGRRDFKDFDARMRRARGEVEPETGSKGFAGSAGMHVGIELVAGLIGGTLIGYGLDSWFGTWPVLAIAFFFLGAAAGMANAYRYIRRLSEMPDGGSKR